MPRRKAIPQDPLPFDTPDPAPPAPLTPEPGPTESQRPRRGRPRKWASEADRKRAYRQRLAADLAQPERLRRELRTERQRVARQDLEIARLARDLAQSAATAAAAEDRQVELESIIGNLEAKVNDWRSRARALAGRLHDERDQRHQDEATALKKQAAKPRRKLPDLRLQSGWPPQPPRRRPLL
jgi:hypothetical protein